MATVPGRTVPLGEEFYITSDGQPMAETEVHRLNLTEAIDTLQMRFESVPDIYVGGNMFVHYEPGNKLRHLAPDVFVVFGVPRRIRENYLIWEEGHAPDLVIEFTSRTTRDEDLQQKFEIYRDRMGVNEYFLFDPLEEYLEPSLQGFRLRDGAYVPIEPIDGRLPSEVLGLDLERDDWHLRFRDPATRRRLLTSREWAEAEAARRQQAEAERQQAEAARQQAEAERDQEAAARRQAEAELERLRQEIAALRPPPA
jgi:Uma2 family endonuclease